MSASSLRRFALLLFIAAASFGILECTCATHRQPAVGCPTEPYSKSNPSICIMDNLTASPSHAPVYDVQPDAGNMPTTSPVTIHWFSQRGGNLQITMETAGCTTPVTCDGKGHCKATVTTQTLRDEEKKVCKYSFVIGDKKYDPEDTIIITPCCY